MTPGQRAVNMLYVLRDFSPLGITLAMIALPLAVLSAPQDSFSELINGNAASLSWLRKLALLLWIAQKVNTWVLYQHIGLARVANFHSQEVWTAPCKFGSGAISSLTDMATDKQTRHTETSSTSSLDPSLPPNSSFAALHPQPSTNAPPSTASRSSLVFSAQTSLCSCST